MFGVESYSEFVGVEIVIVAIVTVEIVAVSLLQFATSSSTTVAL